MGEQFSWQNFEVDFLYKIVNDDKTPGELREATKVKEILVAKMNAICECPDVDFIKKYREIIETTFLSHNPRIVRNVFKLKDTESHHIFIGKLMRKNLTRGIITNYLKALYEFGGAELYADSASEFQYTRCADLAKSQASNPVDLYDFQDMAYLALKDYYVTKNNSSGFLIMPTGSGKTRTSVAFLLQEMIAKDYQVVWLTHRHMLIDQTATTFWDNCASIKRFNAKKKKFEIACISGNHQGMYAIAKTNDVMIISNQSGFRGLRFLNQALKKKVMIVVDEAHHTVGKTYRNVIDEIKRIRTGVKLLGLTATPVRVNEKEEAYLHQIYGGKIIYQANMAELIAKGFLAEPKFERFPTKLNFEEARDSKVMRDLQRNKELPPAMAEKIVNAKLRNDLIINKYLEKRDIYGKTLIFAVNQVHAATLAEALKKKGVKADFVCSDNDKLTNAAIINRFKNGALEVLVNVNILTEGSDIPDIHAVFLTRPSASKALIMQMIGRGMRGIHAKGTKDVMVVDFYDQWDIFKGWLNPEFEMQGELLELETIRKKGIYEFVTTPWEVIFKAYDSIDGEDAERIKLETRICLPKGWYSLEDHGVNYKLMVYEDQYQVYQAIRRDRDKLIISATHHNPYGLVKYYFNNFISKPTDKDLEVFWNNLAKATPMPFYELANKNKIEPLEVAKRCREEGLNLEQIVETVYKQYGEAKEAYGNFEYYYESVRDAYEYLRTGMKHPHKALVEEIPESDIALVIDEPYEITDLYNEVIKEQFDGVDEGIKSIRWTTKPMKTYFGVYDSYQHTIEINKLLNSSQVEREAIKYVIYHELLHRDNLFHNSAFRRLEALYPESEKWEHHLKYELFHNYTFEF